MSIRVPTIDRPASSQPTTLVNRAFNQTNDTCNASKPPAVSSKRSSEPNGAGPQPSGVRPASHDTPLDSAANIAVGLFTAQPPVAKAATDSAERLSKFRDIPKGATTDVSVV